MDADSFNELALRDLAGEATDDEHRALETELAAHPERRGEFEQIKQTYDFLRTAAPMSEAARAAEPELPAYRLNELRTAVRQHFGPAANRQKTAAAGGLVSSLRWLMSGSTFAAVGVVVVLVLFANRSVEVGLYGTDLMRGDDTALSPADIPSAHLITFTQDAPFDQWQNQSLHWYEHAKIWVDNEHDLLHIVQRAKHGHVLIQTIPLAPTSQGQRDQIKQVVESLSK
jgi:hypothetical protein